MLLARGIRQQVGIEDGINLLEYYGIVNGKTAS